MPTRQSVSNFDAFLKEIYPDITVELIAAKKYPTLGWIPKADDFGGDTIVVPIHYGNPAGRSKTYANAWTNANTTKSTKFVITERKTDYNVVQIEAEVIAASNKGNYSFAEAKALEIKGKLEELGKSLSIGLFRDTTGVIGEVSAIGNGSGTNDLLTLTNKSDVHYFSVGQVLNFRDASNSNALITSDGSATAAPVVEALDHANGTIEVSLNTAFSGGGGENVAVGDTIVADGDNTKSLAGLASWLPMTAPTSGDSFFSVDRSVNVAALSGHRVNNTSRTLLENLEELGMLIGEFGGSPDIIVMNPRAGRQLSQQLGTKVERMDGGNGKFGFSGFEMVNFMVPNIKVMFDYTCPPNRAYMLQRDTWKIHHLGGLPHIAKEDGLMVRQGGSSFDGVECYARYWAELACRAPGYNGVCAVATS